MNNDTRDSGLDLGAAIESAEPQAVLYNPPGRSSLSYRAGTYASFLESMLAQVQTQILRTGTAKGRSPLASLNVEGPSDIAVALLKAWAVVGDVLTFYQERIINEGYLRTATEPRSVLALVRTIGYVADPGLAAATYLAFTLRDTKSSPAPVTIPAGTGVMSTPTQGQPGGSQASTQSPQTFETTSAILARVEWNSLQPYVPTVSVSQAVNNNSTLIYLSGVTTRLKPAAVILLVGDATDSSGGQKQLLLRTVKTVEPDQTNGYTLVTLEDASAEEAANVPLLSPPVDETNLPLVNPQFFAFRQQAQLFGFNAALWSDAPDNIRKKYGTPKGGAFVSDNGSATWQARNQAMPSAGVRAAIVNEGSFFAGVAGGGVYRLAGDGGAWQPASSGLTRNDVHCLARNDFGHLFAGTAGGGVFRSTDNGDSWVMISGGNVSFQRDEKGNLLPVNTRLPNTVVRAIGTYIDTNSGITYVFAGTDNGAYVTKDDLNGWTSLNQKPSTAANPPAISPPAASPPTSPPINPPINPPATGNRVLSSTVINTVAVLPYKGGLLAFMGTDNSVFTWTPANAPNPGWAVVNQNLPPAKILTLLAYVDAGGQSHVLAGTSVGVYRNIDETWAWEFAGNGLPLSGSQPGAAPAPVGALAYSVDANGKAALFAGTGAGLYTSQDDGTSWTLVEPALNQTLFSLDYEPYQQELDAGIIGDDLSRQFTNHSVTLSPASCVTVQSKGSRWLIDDTSAQRTYVLVYDGAFINVYLTNAGVSAVAADMYGRVLAVTPLDGYVQNEWPDFAVNLHRPELDTIHSGILNGSYIAFSEPAQSSVEGPPSPVLCSPPLGSPPLAVTSPPAPGDTMGTSGQTVSEVYQIQSSTVAPLSEFGRTGTSTVVETNAPDTASSFDRRTTNVFLQSEQLPLLAAQIPQPQPVQGNAIQLAGLIQNLGDNQPLALTGRRASALVVADPGGVLAFKAPGWTSFGLSNTDARSLACDSQNRLFAGTKGGGLFVYTEAEGWASLPVGSTKGTSICALACDNSRGQVLAATEGGGFFASGDAGRTWERVTLPVVDDVSAFAFGNGGAWLCGTDGGGVFLSADAGQTWTPAQTAPSSTDISSLIVNTKNDAFAGTKSGGVFRSTDGGGTWRAVNKGLANLDVRALALDASGRLFAGTHGGGVFVSADDAATWRGVNNGLSNRDVQALTFAAGELFAGTSGGGAFNSTDGGLHWNAVPTGVSNDVRALASDAAGRVYAAARNVALLSSADGTQSIEMQSNLLFTADAQFRADLDLGIIPTPLGKLFDANGVPLTKNATVTTQTSGSRWLVFDGAGVVYLVKHEAGGLNAGADGLDAAAGEDDKQADVLSVYLASHTLQVVAVPSPPPNVLPQSTDATLLVWSLFTETNFSGLITARADEISYGPAPATGAIVGEVGFVQSTESLPNEKYSTVTLASPLVNVYDPNTVVVCANIAPATHGETVPLEVLGSGNASRPNQSFTLKKPPLTYVPSPSSTNLSESTLTIRVSNIVEEGGIRIEAGKLKGATTEEMSARWTEVGTLYDAGPHDHVYMVRSSDKGQATVIFGDGIRGARLTTGRENVVATYRSGIGTAGNLGAGQLTMLKTKPAGVRGVTNPVPAEGGVNPEPMLTARTHAPLTVRTLARIVSLLDYEDFVRTQPGVAKVQVEIIYGGRTRTIYLTIADEDGGPVSPTFTSDLLAAINLYQASAQKVQVGSYEPLYFNLKAQVYYDSQFEAKEVQTLVKALLIETFSFERREFGQGLESSELVKLIQGVHGVIAVNLEAFYLVGASEDLATRLSAERAHWDAALKQIRPAQLLLINARNGVTLDMVPIP
ncbi:MAG: hypothetical protein QOJ76_1629 [Acidobacteriota bacterium]|jgi:hypothetical protein|nr:hypothetical protein [Acidobacteriota bacterium]